MTPTRTDYCEKPTLDHILAALMPANRLAILTSLQTGLRIDDVLHLKTEDLKRDRFTVKEMKTGKSRRIRLTRDLREALFRQAGRFFVFEGRNDPKKPRTRQAVYKDLVRAQNAFRVKRIKIRPHSARKIYAVNAYRKCGDIKKVQALLNHSSEAVTMLYALADEITAQTRQPREK